jgi:hypothetical protein|nr:MAG TPA: hypothetical protein [Caudoviricetes sp.]
MPKYQLKGLVTTSIDMEVEADNLMDAIDKCHSNYSIECVDDTAPIIKDGKILTENNSELYLCDILNSNLHKY